MDTGRMLLQAESSQDTAPFFGFIGAAAALVFSCAQSFRQLTHRPWLCIKFCII